LIRKLAILITFIALSGCSGYNAAKSIKDNAGPARLQSSPEQMRLDAVPELDGKKITIAVYNFMDKTGQRKPSDRLANLSSAVTQGSEVWVIKALQDVGGASCLCCFQAYYWKAVLLDTTVTLQWEVQEHVTLE
jgi:hypothetical protein